MKTDPLIKDEKIRKAVRAWADMHKIENVYYCEYSWKEHLAWLEDGESGGMLGESTGIDIPIIEVENKKFYTIAELCGEIDYEPYKLPEGGTNENRTK